MLLFSVNRFLHSHFRFDDRLGLRRFFRPGRTMSGQVFLEGQGRIFRLAASNLIMSDGIFRSITAFDDQVGKMRARFPAHMLVDLLGESIFIDFDAHGILQKGYGPPAFGVFRPEPFAVNGTDGEVLDADGHIDLDLVDVVVQSTVNGDGSVLVVDDIDQFGPLKFQH